MLRALLLRLLFSPSRCVLQKGRTFLSYPAANPLQCSHIPFPLFNPGTVLNLNLHLSSSQSYTCPQLKATPVLNLIPHLSPQYCHARVDLQQEGHVLRASLLRLLFSPSRCMQQKGRTFLSYSAANQLQCSRIPFPLFSPGTVLDLNLHLLSLLNLITKIVEPMIQASGIPCEGRSIFPARRSSLDGRPRSHEGPCPRGPCPLGRPTLSPGTPDPCIVNIS